MYFLDRAGKWKRRDTFQLPVGLERGGAHRGVLPWRARGAWRVGINHVVNERAVSCEDVRVPNGLVSEHDVKINCTGTITAKVGCEP